MSNYLCDLSEGAEISCQGPFGDFILRPPLRDTIFIATGTGIAPFRSMLHWLLGSDAGSTKDGRVRPSSIDAQSRHQGKQLWLVSVDPDEGAAEDSRLASTTPALAAPNPEIA